MASDSPISLQIVSAPAYEFILSLCAWSDGDEHASLDIGPEWFAAIRAQAPRELLESIAEFGRGKSFVWAHLLTFISSDAAAFDVPAFINLMEQQDPAEVHFRLVGGGVRYCERATPPAVMRAAVAGDPAARREFLRTSYPEDARWQAALRHLLMLHSRALHTDLIEILRGWYDAVFRAQEAELLKAITCDAANRQTQLAHAAPLEVIRSATNGYEYTPEEGIRRVVLVPSVVIRPQLHLLDHTDTKWICVPVADACLATDPRMPPARLVRVLKALSDERRLRVLHAIAAGSYTLGQLADMFEMSKTLMHHHLTMLRGAGLILVHTTNPMVYSLRYDTLALLGPLLDAYLAPPPQKGSGRDAPP
jgi:DNA-binding transcriptional ArsR family regulator